MHLYLRIFIQESSAENCSMVPNSCSVNTIKATVSISIDSTASTASIVFNTVKSIYWHYNVEYGVRITDPPGPAPRHSPTTHSTRRRANRLNTRSGSVEMLKRMMRMIDAWFRFDVYRRCPVGIVFFRRVGGLSWRSSISISNLNFSFVFWIASRLSSL